MPRATVQFHHQMHAPIWNQAFAGMLGAMTGADALVEVAGQGAVAGLLIQLILHVLDRSMSGEVNVPRPSAIE